MNNVRKEREGVGKEVTCIDKEQGGTNRYRERGRGGEEVRFG